MNGDEASKKQESSVFRRRSVNGDELDAVTCALVGKFYLEKKHIAIGDQEEMLMILPKINHSNSD